MEELPADKRAMTVGTLSSTFAEITMSARDYSIFSRILVKFLPRTLSWQATTLMEAINICLSSPACTATMQEASPYLGSDATDDLTAGDFENIFGTNFARKKAETEVKQKTESGAGTPVSNGMPDPDDWEPEEKERKSGVPKSQSKIWKELKPHHGQTKTNGLTGKDRRYYQWDGLHNEVEVYDQRGKPIDAIDPTTGERLFKDVSKHKDIDV